MSGAAPNAPSTRGWFADFVESFTALARLPIGFWIIVFVFVIDAMAYFGVLTLMNSYFTRDLALRDTHAGWFVSVFTMLVTLFMLGAGSYAESFGLRRALIAALMLTLTGRVVYCLLPGVEGGGVLVAALVG